MLALTAATPDVAIFGAHVPTADTSPRQSRADLVRAEAALAGAQTGFWLWLGFVVTTNLETVLFENRPLGLYLISNGYHLVGMLGMGALLAVWRRREAPAPAYQT